jgi:cytosine/adenosine deaminase-related metal-dependent hydrolase
VDLLRAATVDGHASLGFPDAGRIAAGAPADLVTVEMRSPRTAGAGAGVEAAVFAATAADVTHVFAQGRLVATPAGHDDLGAALDRSIRRIWED